MSGLGEVERKCIEMKMASAARQVSLGAVEKTQTERRQEKKKEKKREKENMKKGSSSDPAAAPSAPESNRPIHFQYAEGLMNLTMTVWEDFDASPNSLEMKGLCVQVSDIYSSRLGITALVSDMKFNFTSLAPDCMLVSLKDDEMGLGFEDQVKTYRTSLSEALVNNEALGNFPPQTEIMRVDSDIHQSGISVLVGENTQLVEELRSRVCVLEGRTTAIQEQNTAFQQQSTAIQQQSTAIQQQLQTHQALIDQLLLNAELQYVTRRRILIQDARHLLLEKLGLTKQGTWEEFIKNLSPAQKASAGVSEDVLELMATGMFTLNEVVHTFEEIAHAVNNIRNQTLKTSFQALFTFRYGVNPEDVEFPKIF